jgi:cell division protein FtsW
MVCAAVLLMMLYLAGMQMKWIGIALACAAPVMYYMLFHVKFRAERMKVFLNPEADPKGAGFHILQSLIAVGTGGIRGKGLMEGVQKLFFLPEPHTDFIFANNC